MKDLQERATVFAQDVRTLIMKLPRSLIVFEDAKQLIRSSGSVAANYIEANDCLGEKDRLFRFRIARKEAKESAYWLQLILGYIDIKHHNECARLRNEAVEIKLILSSIIKTIESRL